MSKNYYRFKKVLGVLLLFIAIAFFIFWEFLGRKELLSKEVIVLKEDVTKGQCITEDMLYRKKVSVENIIENSIVDKDKIVGLEAKHFIPKNMQLIDKFFDSPALVLTGKDKIMRIPNDWMYSYPETIRRKDEIYIYAIKTENSDDEDYTNQNYNENTNPENTDNSQNSENANNEEQAKDKAETKKDEKEQFVFKTTVAYVKDNANREVENVDNDRLTGTAVIEEIEIVVSDKNFRKLEALVNEGYKLILMYQ